MKKSLFMIGIAAAIVLLIIVVFISKDKEGEVESEQTANMEITSVFNEGERIPAKYTADGEDVNPGLEISDIPENAKSLVLIVDDPDAPAGVWVHWVVINIPVTNKINENEVPAGAIQCMNDFWKVEYGGPAPPSGTHRYYFKLYALDSELDLDESAKKADVESAMQGHIIEQAQLMGVYSRG